MDYDVFFSHSSQNSELAAELVDHLEKNGVRCWVAPRDLAPGSEWAEGIVDGIESSRLFLVLLCPQSNSSPQVLREVERAVNKQVTIIPVMNGQFTLSKSLEFFISTHQWMYISSQPQQKEVSSLVAAVRARLDEKEDKPVQEGRDKPPPSRRWLLAAALLACLCLGISVFFITRHSGEDPWQRILAEVNNADFVLPLTTNKQLFHPGDELKVGCLPPRDGYLTIFSHTKGTGTVTVLFPNKGRPDNKVTAGQAIEIPGPDDHFRLKADSDTGKTTLVAFLHATSGIFSPSSMPAGSAQGGVLELETSTIAKGFQVDTGPEAQTGAGSIELQLAN